MKKENVELSIVMPCLNEAETIGTCIQKASTFLEKSGVEGEIVVADNGSVDGSQKIALEAGARVVNVERKGYGSALMGGIDVACGKFVIMGDSDDSYDFLNLGPFLEKLREGYDLVMGNRFKGGIEPGSMPFLHRYLGNPVLTKIGQILFRCPIGDFHCGLRGFTKKAAEKMALRTTGMEFASEIVVKSSLKKMKICEVPTTLSKDGRSKSPHLRTWRDGWRHLRFLLLFSPNWLFLYPGAVLMAFGAAITLMTVHGTLTINNVAFDLHTLLYGSMAIILGYQSVIFAVVSKAFAVDRNLLPSSKKLDLIFNVLKLEAGLIVGGAVALMGFAGSVTTFVIWSKTSFGELDPSVTMRISIPSLMLLTLGIQTVLFSFLTNMIKIK